MQGERLNTRVASVSPHPNPLPKGRGNPKENPIPFIGYLHAFWNPSPPQRVSVTSQVHPVSGGFRMKRLSLLFLTAFCLIILHFTVKVQPATYQNHKAVSATVTEIHSTTTAAYYTTSS